MEGLSSLYSGGRNHRRSSGSGHRRGVSGRGNDAVEHIRIEEYTRRQIYRSFAHRNPKYE